MIYETLEAKRMFAGPEVGYAPKPIGDPFANDAVTYQQMVAKAGQTSFVKHELIVAIKTSDSVAAAGLQKLNWPAMTGDSGIRVVQTLAHSQRGHGERVTLVHLKLSGNSEMFNVMRTLDNRPDVMWSAPNFTYEGDPREYIPNDPRYPEQWHHDKMRNNLAWDITRGSSSIIVAVTDDGVDLMHDDLRARIWLNDDFPDGIDNDGNGYIDDYSGWDFNNNNNSPSPEGLTWNHGTHCAGIAAAGINNLVGGAGVAGGATIMPIQFYGPKGWTSTMVNSAFTYATDNGAKIVSTSYSIDKFISDPTFLAAMQYLYDGGVLHFNSAGNNGELNPQRQRLTQTILVASTDQNDVKSTFSNYGTGIDLCAPGEQILSTITGNRYDTYSGTSMSTPAVAGAAALIWSANPTWSREQVVAQLFATADNIDSLNPGLRGLLGGGRVNSFRALTEAIGAPKVRVVNNLPANGGTLDNPKIDNFDLGFDQIMDPAAMNNLNDFSLRGAGLDNQFNTADDVVYSLTSDTYQIGTNLLKFRITEGYLPYGKYRLTIQSGGVQNPFGTDLDGDNNGSAGGDFNSEFTLKPSLNGWVQLDKIFYKPTDQFKFVVGDGNASDPVMVRLTTSGGDSETVTLTNNGNLSWSGSINSVAGSAVAGNGILDVAIDQTITITYFDSDDGTGNRAQAKDTAKVSTIVQYKSTDTPINIIDLETVSSTITVADEGLVNDLNVELNISHSYVNDLEIYLRSPDGTRISLVKNIDNIANFTGTLLDDEAGTSIRNARPPFYGVYRPQQPLSTFDLKSITGDWTLEVYDQWLGDVGTINDWSLFLETRSPDRGSLSLDRQDYSLSDTVEITVRDRNHTGPLTVNVTTSGGDIETVVLSQTAPFTFTGSIGTVSGLPVSGNGQLNVKAGQSIKVTYDDQDTGNGLAGREIQTAVINNVFEYRSLDVPVEIVEGPYTSTIEITDSGVIRDLDVLIDISHEYVSDLYVVLVAPDGTRIDLVTRNGGDGDNFEQTRFDDEATMAISEGFAPFTGHFRPAGELKFLDGMSITGTWKLEIEDIWPSEDDGVLNAWSLFIDVGSAGEGILNLDSELYNIGSMVGITVQDGNHSGPLTVSISTTGGDSETVNLWEQSPGTFVAWIPTSSGVPVQNNGELDVSHGQQFTVRYLDQDNGNGSSPELTKTAKLSKRIEYISTDAPVGIPDLDTVFSNIEIFERGTIADLEVSLDLTHSWDSDLSVFLIAPDGTRIELFSDVGGSGDNFRNTVLDDEAETAIADGVAPFKGLFRPAGSLDILQGQFITGKWTLEITDDTAGDIGTLDAWSLWIDVIPRPAVSPDGPSSIIEGDAGVQSVTFTVNCDPTTEPVTLDYRTTTQGFFNPATPGDDFVPVSGNLVFLPGETSKEIVIQVRGNRVVELEESFGLEIFNVSPNADAVRSVHECVIIDNDEWSYSGTIDFGTDTSPVAALSVGVGLLPYDPINGLGWTDNLSNVQIVDRRLGTAALRDIALTSRASFAMDVPNGNVQLRVTWGDPTMARDNMRITLEGAHRPLVSTAAGQVITRIYTVAVTDGQLNIDFTDMGGSNPLVAVSSLAFGRRV
jgi:subtilisin-like proprotein convertase family protein/subtilisin family serine protease